MRDDRPSSTAITVALSLLLLEHDPRLHPLVKEDEGRLLRRAIERVGGRPASILRRMDRSVAWRGVVRAVENRVAPGIGPHLALRKRAIDFNVRTAIAAGLRQVVVIGAGFDPLAYRLASSSPEARFFELDHPATQFYKSRALGDAGGAPRNLRLIPADLSRVRLATALGLSHSFQPAAPTVFVAEGLLMYLPEDAVRGLFQQASEFPSIERRVIFTFMRAQPSGRIGFKEQSPLIDWWLARKSEQMKWAIDPEGLAAFLAGCGWSLAGVLQACHLREMLASLSAGDEIQTAEGECIGVATMGDSAEIGASLLPRERFLSAGASALRDEPPPEPGR